MVYPESTLPQSSGDGTTSSELPAVFKSLVPFEDMAMSSADQAREGNATWAEAREELRTSLLDRGVKQTDVSYTLGLFDNHARDAGAIVVTAKEVRPKAASEPATLELLLSRFRTAAELAAEPVPKTRWRIGRLFPEVALVQLTGAPKGGGKSTFLIHAIQALLSGTPFLGEETLPCPVVYLTEQGRDSFEPEYLTPAGLMGSPDLHILYGYQTSGCAWETVVEAAVEKCLRTGAKLLVVDTFAHFARLQGDRENGSGYILAALRTLQDAKDTHGLCIVVIHHDRKSGGEVWDSGRGGNAFAAAVDVIINLRRPTTNEQNTIREIRAEGRYSGLYDSLFIELTDKGYVAHGSAPDVAREKAAQAVLDTAPTSEADALSMNDLLHEVRKEHPDMTRTTLQRAVEAYVRHGTLRCRGAGKRGDPYRYYLPLEE